MSLSFTCQKQINKCSYCCGDKEEDEYWMAKLSFQRLLTQVKWIKNSNGPQNKYLNWAGCMQLSWAYPTHPSTVHCRYLGYVRPEMRSTLVVPIFRQQGSQLGSQTSSTSQTLRPVFALQCSLEHKKTPTFKHHCLHSHFFQENVGNYITLPISIVHLCLFLYSLCTGNVFWL